MYYIVITHAFLIRAIQSQLSWPFCDFRMINIHFLTQHCNNYKYVQTTMNDGSQHNLW